MRRLGLAHYTRSSGESSERVEYVQPDMFHTRPTPSQWWSCQTPNNSLATSLDFLGSRYLAVMAPQRVHSTYAQSADMECCSFALHLHGRSNLSLLTSPLLPSGAAPGGPLYFVAAHWVMENSFSGFEASFENLALL